MAAKIQGTVKWFSNQKGFGFITPTSDNAPTKDDIFVHQSNIVTDAEYRTLKDGFEVQFEAITDENGKLKCQNVTSKDGNPCPGPEPRDRNRRNRKKKQQQSNDNSGDDAKGSDGGEKESNDAGTTDNKENATNGAAANQNGENKGGKQNNNRRRKGKNGKKPDDNQSSEKPNNGNNNEQPRSQKKKPTWYDELDKNVKDSLRSREIKVDSGRIFVAVGKARVKLGTGGYSALAHSEGRIAEGTYTCGSNGKVSFTWQHVLTFDSEWKSSTPEAEKDLLVAEIDLMDESITPTGGDETTVSLWGEGKTDPKEALEKSGFQMRKVALGPTPGGGRRNRNRGRRNHYNKKKDNNATNGTKPKESVE